MSGNLKAYLAEILGTFVVVFAAAGSSSMSELFGSNLALAELALAYGAGAAAAAFAFGPASGGHFNPAITAGMFAAKRIDAVTAAFYVTAQLLGAAVAGLFLRAVLHGAPSLGTCALSGVGFRAGTLIEAVATFVVVSTFLSTAGIRRGPARLGPLAVGLAVAAGVLAVGPATGAAMNPARAFGPAVATGRWAHWYVYWIGPMAGGVCAALLQENIFAS